MKVRDKLQNGYKGHAVECPDKYCPCRPCFNVHDCGYFLHGKYVERFVCATNFNEGCPQNEFGEYLRPTHVLSVKTRRKGMVKKCHRCGQKVILGKGEFNFIDFETYKKK